MCGRRNGKVVQTMRENTTMVFVRQRLTRIHTRALYRHFDLCTGVVGGWCRTERARDFTEDDSVARPAVG